MPLTIAPENSGPRPGKAPTRQQQPAATHSTRGVVATLAEAQTTGCDSLAEERAPKLFLRHCRQRLAAFARFERLSSQAVLSGDEAN